MRPARSCSTSGVSGVGGITTPSSSSVREPGGHASRLGRAHVGVMRPAGREADQLGPVEDREDHRDVREMGPPAVGVVQDPGQPRFVALGEDRGHRRRHGPEVHRDVLRLHDHLALRVEEGGGGVAALLDVGRVRRAHQHRAHLLAGGAQRAEHHLERYRSEAHPPASSSTASGPAAAAPAGRHHQRRPLQLDHGRSAHLAAPGPSTRASTGSPPNTTGRVPAVLGRRRLLARGPPLRAARP